MEFNKQNTQSKTSTAETHLVDEGLKYQHNRCLNVRDTTALNNTGRGIDKWMTQAYRHGLARQKSRY